jgi:hypothetical protein
MTFMIEEFEIKKPSLLAVIRANIRFWVWVAMHDPKYWGKTIQFGFKPALFSVHEKFKNNYFVSYEVAISRNSRLGVQAPMIIISAYERATNADTSLIWK